MEKEFWRCLTRDGTITVYNTKAVNVDAYQRRDNNSDTAGKVENETRQQMNNLFQRLCCVRSFLLSRKRHLLFATGSFHFLTGQAKLSQANFYSMDFLKVRHFPGEIATNRFLEFFLKLLSCYNRLSKQYFIRFLYGAGPLVTSSLAWLLRGL